MLSSHEFIDKCCDEFKNCINRFNNIGPIIVGSGEISGALTVSEDGVSVSDGWNDLPYIPFNYCPFCGTQLKK